MDNFVIGNMVWNGGLVVIVGFLFKNWMNEVKEGIEKLTDQVKTQNGNVAKVKEELHIQLAKCKQRNEGRRVSDKCDDWESADEQRL